MGSIYEYKLEYVPELGGKRVPPFIITHEVIPYNGAFFGYSESGHQGWDVIEYTTKQSLFDRVVQLHVISPFVKPTSIEQVTTGPAYPQHEPYTYTELKEMVDTVWNKMFNLNILVNGRVPYGEYMNDYLVEHYYARNNIQSLGDGISIVPVAPAEVPPELDVYWSVLPTYVNGTLTQVWNGRQFNEFELDKYKRQKKDQINAEREQQLYTTFFSEAFQKKIDISEASRGNIRDEVQRCLLSIINTEPSYDITWRVADNSSVVVTREQFLEMNNELALHTDSVYKASWARKVVVDASATRDAIDKA